jgi:hypothetical protein
VNEETAMTIASALLQQHIQTLVDDNAQWQTLIADDIVWELAHAPAFGHPARLSHIFLQSFWQTPRIGGM